VEINKAKKQEELASWWYTRQAKEILRGQQNEDYK